MEQREAAICQWFDMWLTKRDTGIRDLFAPDAVYIESWGPEYHGADKIAWWFTEWNRRGTVERWDIRQFFHKGDQTVVGIVISMFPSVFLVISVAPRWIYCFAMPEYPR